MGTHIFLDPQYEGISYKEGSPGSLTGTLFGHRPISPNGRGCVRETKTLKWDSVNVTEQEALIEMRKWVTRHWSMREWIAGKMREWMAKK
jgi:hypothetical protein